MKYFSFKKQSLLAMTVTDHDQLCVMGVKKIGNKIIEEFTEVSALPAGAIQHGWIQDVSLVENQLSDWQAKYALKNSVIHCLLPREAVIASHLDVPAVLETPLMIAELEDCLAQIAGRERIARFAYDYTLEALPHAREVRLHYLAVDAGLLSLWQPVFLKLKWRLATLTWDALLLQKAWENLVKSIAGMKQLIVRVQPNSFHLYFFDHHFFHSFYQLTNEKLNEKIAQLRVQALLWWHDSASIPEERLAFINHHQIIAHHVSHLFAEETKWEKVALRALLETGVPKWM